jgi:hypothetical protein
MKETQPQVLESTSQWPQKILALAPNLNRPLHGRIIGDDVQYRQVALSVALSGTWLLVSIIPARVLFSNSYKHFPISTLSMTL